MGLEFSHLLAWRGIVEVGHFYRWRWDEDGEQFSDIYDNFEEAVTVLDVLRGAGEEVRLAWDSVVVHLRRLAASGLSRSRRGWVMGGKKSFIVWRSVGCEWGVWKESLI